MFLKKKTTKTELAFGKIPAYCKYELFMERYRSAAEIIEKYSKNTSAPRKFLDADTQNAFSMWSIRRAVKKVIGNSYNTIDFRALRILGVRRTLNLENHLWFWRVNTWVGRNLPGICPEINWILRKEKNNDI